MDKYLLSDLLFNLSYFLNYISNFSPKVFLNIFRSFSVCPEPLKPLKTRRKMAAAALAQENIWFNKAQCEDAEKLYFEKLSGAKVKLNSACFFI